MAETKKNWTEIPGPYPRKACLEAYNKASRCMYDYFPASNADEACEAIIREVRAVLKAKSLEEAVAFLEGDANQLNEDTVFDVWASDWKLSYTAAAMIKRVRAVWRQMMGLEAV